VLYQAGTSDAGRNFAARHAECIFISGPSKTVLRGRVQALRALKRQESSRSPIIYALATIITDETDSAAIAKFERYRSFADPVGALTLMSGWTGVDFSSFNRNAVIQHVENDAGRSALENVTRADPSRQWTVAEVAQHVSIGGIGPVFVGSPQTVCDQLEEWVDDTGIDGFNLAFATRPETFSSIVDLIVPELQRRGRYRREYLPGTLREKLFGAGPYRQGHLNRTHGPVASARAG
jgi:alkanesulfonate monooxygenase